MMLTQSIIRVCPLCDASGPVLLFDLGRYHVVRCQGCGLRYTTPLPTDDELAVLYGETFYPARSRGLDWRALRERYFGTVAASRRALLGRMSPGRVLDVGCGEGSFLRTMARAGWQVKGTEYSDAAVTAAAKRGLTLYHGTLTDAHFPERSFDLVTLWAVAEHLPDPRVDLAEAHRILADGGMLVIEVPNGRCLAARLFGPDWYQLDVPRHLTHFTPATLERLLGECGFAVVRRVNFCWYAPILAAISVLNSLRVRPRSDGPGNFASDFMGASLGAKLKMLAALPIAGGAGVVLGYLDPLLTGNGELMCLIARKVE